MDRCVIWGNGADYEKIINQIKFEELKGNLKIIAVVTRKDEIFGSKRDGYPLITKEELPGIDFDVLIIASSAYYTDILMEAGELGIPADHIMDGRACGSPLFDYTKYMKLIKDPVTILSDDCWGGYVYHELFLRFTSPLINVFWLKDSFCRFIQDPLYYFANTLECYIEGNLRENVYPVGQIGEKDKRIRLEFVHSPNFKEAEALWEKRKKRINKERIFVKLGIDATEENKEEYLNIFEQIPFPKICFYSGEGEPQLRDIVYLKRFEWSCYQGRRMDSVKYTDYVRNMDYLYKDIDLISLLNGEKNYIREA